ncbi:hypothetical protein O3S80_24750 [Streptomyces sp. Lzd4kr]|nr:hypothetical protein [Streptomyces sp. Lzd4kr]
MRSSTRRTAPLVGSHGLYGMAVNSEDELSLPSDWSQPFVVNSNGDPVR